MFTSICIGITLYDAAVLGARVDVHIIRSHSNTGHRELMTFEHSDGIFAGSLILHKNTNTLSIT